MKTLTHILLSALLAAPTLAAAQERTASGNLPIEASWNALRSMVDKTNGDIQLMRIELNAVKSCAVQGKLYAPEANGADSAGCLNVTPDFFVVAKTGPRNQRQVFVDCPSDSKRVSCSGSRTPDLSDTCLEEDCAYVGTAPNRPNGCTVSAVNKGSSSGYIQASVWAVCAR